MAIDIAQSGSMKEVIGYATKVPADVCAKFAPDYLRCVETLPKDVPIAMKKNK